MVKISTEIKKTLDLTEIVSDQWPYTDAQPVLSYVGTALTYFPTFSKEDNSDKTAIGMASQ